MFARSEAVLALTLAASGLYDASNRSRAKKSPHPIPLAGAADSEDAVIVKKLFIEAHAQLCLCMKLATILDRLPGVQGEKSTSLRPQSRLEKAVLTDVQSDCKGQQTLHCRGSALDVAGSLSFEAHSRALVPPGACKLFDSYMDIMPPGCSRVSLQQRQQLIPGFSSNCLPMRVLVYYRTVAGRCHVEVKDLEETCSEMA
eukprot:1623266-Amphidinium_carterae.1